MQEPNGRPLAGIYVLDFVPGPMAALGRQLAELGAEVVRVEPPAGLPDRAAVDDRAGQIAFAAHNVGKRATVVDPSNASDQARLQTLLQRADIVLLDASADAAFPPHKSALHKSALDPSTLRAQRPDCVVVSVSAFGTGNALSHWQMTEPVLYALSGSLSRSGFDGLPPLLPPAGIAFGCAAAQGVWVILSALYHALRTGRGDHLDFSALDAVMQAFDPGFGVGGSAALGARPSDLPPGRPTRGYWYPVLRCADGEVRICVLAPRQWDSLFDWMGQPAAFADRSYRDIYTRMSKPALWQFIEKFIADKTRAELEREGEARGIPVVGLLELAEVIVHPQVVARGALTPVLAGDSLVALPNGALLMDGKRLSPGRDVPALDGDDGLPTTARAASHVTGNPQERPFAGLRVLDLGAIVAGAEQSRLLADLGADVVKVESAASPDATRRPLSGLRMVASCAAGHRNKRGLGINLKDPRGRDCFLALVAQADIVLSNFKPGTLEKMGLAHADLLRVNAKIISAESSAFGATGPLSRRMGYGPLVRAMSGLISGWRYEAAEGDAARSEEDGDQGYADQVVVYPDHVAGRVVAIGVVAALIQRLRCDRGAAISAAQLEIILGHLAADVGRIDAGLDDTPPDRPWNVYRARGDDNWCVISVRHQQDWLALVAAISRNELAADPRFATPALRQQHATQLDAIVADWMAQQEASAAMQLLQQAGVPAGEMLRITALPDWPRNRQRQLFRTEHHPLLTEPLTMETSPVVAANMPAPSLRPAPESGEHTREVLREWLHMDGAEIDRLIAAAVLEVAGPFATSPE